MNSKRTFKNYLKSPVSSIKKPQKDFSMRPFTGIRREVLLRLSYCKLIISKQIADTVPEGALASFILIIFL